MKTRLDLLVAAFALATTWLPTAASARDITGTVQLGIDGGIFSYSRLSLTEKDPPPFTMPASSSVETTNFGLLTPGTGIRLAVAPNDSVQLGVRALVAASNVLTETTQTETVGLSLLPSFEVVMAEGAARPFILATLGPIWENLTSKTNVTTLTETTVQHLSFAAGGGIGLHAFASDRFSIDPLFMILGQVGNASGAGQDLNLSGFTIFAGVGFSGWVAGREAKKEEQVEDGTWYEEQRSAYEERNEPKAAPAAAAEAPLATSLPRVVTRLSDGTRLIIEGSPEQEGHTLDVVALIPQRGATEESCNGMHIAAGDKAGKVDIDSISTKEAGTQEYIAATASVPRILLFQMAKYRPASVDVCGGGGTLSIQGQTALKDMLLLFRRKARAAGTWDSGASSDADATESLGDSDNSSSGDALPE